MTPSEFIQGPRVCRGPCVPGPGVLCFADVGVKDLWNTRAHVAMYLSAWDRCPFPWIPFLAQSEIRQLCVPGNPKQGTTQIHSFIFCH